MELNSSVNQIPLVGPSKELLLENLGIKTIRDFLFHIPFKYRDTSNVISISKLKELREGTVIVTVEKIENVYTRFRKVFTRAKVSDSSGSITVIWFNQKYLVNVINAGDTYIFEGKLSKKNNDFVSPTFEKFSGDLNDQNHIGKIIPYYNETAGLSSKWIRSRLAFLKKNLPNLIKEDIPNEILNNHNLLSLKDALTYIHFPDDIPQIQKARERFAFDEMLGVSIKIQRQVNIFQKKDAIGIPIMRKELVSFIKSLPYELTNDQAVAYSEILESMEKTVPMNRLLNGDVGSGKTVVSAIAMYNAYLNGHSSVILAPTTILASQHYNTLNSLFEKVGIKVELRTSNNKVEFITEPQIIVSTHALLYDTHEIHNLGLLIVDEQHRFGVKQREQLMKGRSDGFFPHYLMMSATPIPHTLTNIIFGDMEVSFLRELPPHRIPIQSHYVPFSKREDCFNWIKERIISSNLIEQAFIIFPLIDESEKIDIKAATKEYETLRKSHFKDLSVGILHGQLKNEEKEQVLMDFKAKKYNILISTTVVEVGIDIPDATIMVIEDAQRFGLAQLHQLRGRVGRGKMQSYCFVISGEKEIESSNERLKYFASHSSGFEVADFDLIKRGPGEVYGTKQSGIPNFKVASITDIELLIKTRDITKKIKDLDGLKAVLFF